MEGPMSETKYKGSELTDVDQFLKDSSGLGSDRGAYGL